MKQGCPKFSSPVYPKRTLSPIAAKQYTAATGPKPCWRAWLKMACQSTVCLLTDPLGLAEQPLGPDQQNDDEYDERTDEFQFGRDDQHGDLDEQTDDQGADDRAPRGAEPAEDGGGEYQQQDLESDLVVETLGHAEQDAGQAGEHGPYHPDGRDDAVHVDAGRCGECGVVGPRAGGLPEPGAFQRQHDQHQHDRAEDDDEDVFGGDQDRSPFPRAGAGELGVLMGARSGDV